MINNIRINTTFYDDVRQILQSARNKTYKAVNTAMVKAYWLIGKRIVEEEQNGRERADYGQELIKHLSISLQAEFGKGFSVANLWNFRQFYQTFVEKEKLYTLCRELSWSHIRLIMRIDNKQAVATTKQHSRFKMVMPLILIMKIIIKEV